jgi:hypothetical protein
MGEEITSAKKNGSQNFRIHTASTKVTQSELAQLERAAAERGIRLSEWIREVLFRELRDSDQMNSGDHINYGKRLLTELVGLQVFLTNVLSPMSRGEWLDAEQYEGMNHAAGEGKETSLGATDFGGATTKYTRIKPIATIPWKASV